MSVTLLELTDPAQLRAEVEDLAARHGGELHRRHRVMASAAGQGRGVRGWRLEDASGGTLGYLIHRGSAPVLLALAETGAAAAVGRLLAEELAGGGPALPRAEDGAVELLGPAGPTEAVARALAGAGGGTARRAMGMHLLVCRRLRAPGREPAGAPRRAGPADGEVVAELTAAFIREALPHRAAEAVELGQRAAGELDGEHGLTLWDDDGRAVAITRLGIPAAGGRSISLVYTPPELRGRGYASALVASLTAEALSQGAQVVDLSTDADHPFSTRLYEVLGYERVGAHASWVVDH